MDKNYDLNLPSWGPYSKKFLGLSHIADKKRGIRFDINLFPGFYRRSIIIPRDIMDSGAKIWGSETDLSHFVYRYELQWRDMVYCDAHFYVLDDNNCKVVCNFVNNTDDPQSLNLNLCASLQYPTLYRKRLDDFCIVKDDNVLYIDAVDYKDINCDCTFAVDGLYLGEIYNNGFVDAHGIGGGVFGNKGHYLTYEFNSTPVKEIGLRYRSKKEVPLTLKTTNKSYEILLPPSEDFSLYKFKSDEEVCDFIKILPHGTYFDFDCIVLGTDLKSVLFKTTEKHYTPEISQDGNSLSLYYENINQNYTISWDFDNCFIRELIGENADAILINSIHNHVSTKIYGEGEGHYSNMFLGPIFMDEHSEKSITLFIKRGKQEAKCDNSSEDIFKFTPNTSGEKYAVSQNIMAANTLMNVVYPIYCRQGYIRHNTPGRLWDSLYTWDSGFIGMGLNVLDANRAIDCLNTYMTPIDDKHSPFLLHGSVVPTQIFLYLDIWNKTQSEKFLKEFYPYIKQQYEFFANLGHDEKQMKSGLTKTWHLFYNSGGWDDYPPQIHVRNNKMDGFVTPVITSAITVLCAKMLQQIAEKLNLNEDIIKYDQDINFYTNVLQSYSWDEKSGYFGYVVHNEDGNPVDILKSPDGVNFNMGLDGAYPFIADICTDSQREKIFKNIKEGLLTKYGVSVVDTRAPYYKTDGYWNGSIWMPHQWILWKSLLDYGEIELANHIAKTALDMWQNEVSLTYNCYEHFMIQNGRGAGFHQFSGLSTPVLMWYQSYYIPGNITGGFQTFIDNTKWNNEFTEVTFNVKTKGKNPHLILCMKDSCDYVFTLNGQSIKPTLLYKGTYILTLPTDCSGMVTVSSN